MVFVWAQMLVATAWATSASVTPPPLTVEAHADQQDLMPSTLQWYDASGERTLAEWQQFIGTSPVQDALGRSAAGFTWLGQDQLPLGRRTGALWVAVPLHSPQPALQRILAVTPPRLEQIDAWLLDDQNSAALLGRTGLATPLVERPLLTGAHLAWPLTPPPGASTLVLRVRSQTPLAPQISLWSPRAHDLERVQFDLRHGLEVGGLALATLLALVFALWLHESTWAWYGAGSFGVLLYQTCYSGMAPLWLWPAHPQWTLPALSAALACAHMSWAIFFLLFTPAGGRTARALALGLGGLSIGGTVLVQLRGFEVGVGYQEVAGLLLPLVLPWLAWRAWRTGDQAARFLLLSYGLMAAASILRVTMVRGWMATNPWLENWFFPLSAILTSVVMMLALADRLRALAQQHQKTLEARIQNATADLVRARDAARAAEQFQSRFVARVSHDLRNPLHTLLGYAERARHILDPLTGALQPRDVAQLLQSVEAVQRSGHDMLQLSDELLELARGDTGHLTLNEAPCDLSALAQEIMYSSRWLAQKGGNQVRLALDLAVPVVVLDAPRVKQVLRNLMANAFIATQGGTITLGLRSTAGADTKAAELDLWVSDSGRGIAPQALERIFEPFEQLDASCATGSSGLGLAIARQWVRLMGGDLQVQSAVGVGSVFSWTMQAPITTVATDNRQGNAAPTEACDAPNPPVSARQLNGHVLVVDDEQEQRQLLQDTLESMGLQVALACGGDAAIALLQGAGDSPSDAQLIVRPLHVDLVLTDMNMQGGDGKGLLQWCRRHRPSLAVVCLSGEPQPPGIFDAALLKPASTDLLHGVVQDLLPPALDWSTLRALADSGDGLGVDAWIARNRDQLGTGPLARGVIELGGSLQLAALVRWLP